MKRRNIAIMAMLALTAGQAFAQRCLPQMKGIEVKVGMADGVYNGKKSCKAGYYAGLGLSSYTKGGDKWIYGAEYLQVNQPYRNTSVPIAQMAGEFGYSYNFLSDNSKTVLFYIGGTAPVHQGTDEHILVGHEPWEQLLTRHLVDTTTALVSHNCLVGSVEIRRTKDLLEKVFLVEWYFHDVVFTHPHEGLHSPIPFGFRPISLGAAINLG